MEVLFVLIIVSLLYKGLISKNKDASIALNNPHLNIPKKFSLSPKVWLKNFWENLTTFPKSNTTFGSASLMSTKELNRDVLSKKHDGILIDGKYGRLKNKECVNMLICGSTGSAKTSSLIIPNFLRTNNFSSYIITDPSGEILEAVGHTLVLNGVAVKVLNLEGQGQSLCYNPLTMANSTKEIGKLCRIILDSSSSGATTEKFWIDGGCMILESLVKALKNYPDQSFCNMANLKFLLDSYNQKDNKTLDTFMAKHLKKKEDFTAYQGIVNGSDSKIVAGFISTCRTALSLYSEEHLSRLTSINTIDLKELRRTRTALFIQFGEGSTAYYAGLLKILYTQIFDMLMEKPITPFNRHVHIFLEEFANVGKILNFSKYITTLRKRGCNLILVIQAVEQITALYGQHDSEAIMTGGINTKLFMSNGLSLKTCQHISEIIGRTTIQQAESGHLSARSVLNPDEVRLLPKDTGILLHHSRKPALVRLNRYYLDKNLSALAGRYFQYNQGTPLPPLKFIPLDQETLPSSTPSQKPKPPIKNKKKDKPDPNDDIVFDL